jgi:Lipid A 3-O-deacylase (PagL)
MLGILRLAAGGLFLILTVFFFTVAAQTNDSLREDLQKTESSTESTQKPIEKESLTSFFKPDENPQISPKSAATVTDEPQMTTERSVYKHRRGAIEYNFEFGVAPFRPTHFAGPDEYDRSGRRMTTLDIRIGRTIGTVKGVSYAYMFGITPLVVAFRNEVKNASYVSPTATPNVYPTIRETTYGFGITPANFRFTFLPNHRIKPFIKLGAGALYFNKAMPIPVAGRYHFMGDWGGGLMIHSKKNPKRFLSIGYRYFHISNANIYGKENNPGYNANTFYIGFSFFK